MNMIENDLVGKFAVPDHPITCLNPAPWEIDEIKIRITVEGVKLLIRNKDSMWFNANNCYIDTLQDCLEYMRIKGLIVDDE